MASAAERLSALRQKLQEARDDNLKAVADEGLRVQTTKRNRLDSDSSLPSSPRQRRTKPKTGSATKRARTKVDVGSADEADGEDADDRWRSMKRRARMSHRARATKQCAKTDDDSESGAVTYGDAAGDEGDVDTMVSELQQVEKRRAKFRRRRAFDEDRTDITFINEGNRIFNRALERHFDKFESVKKLKESLERGTA